jgi:hypothetical protein
MHPDLEALIRAYDAAVNANQAQRAGFIAEFERQLRDLLLRTPGLSEESLRKAVRRAYDQWLRKNQKPTTLPPKA